MEVRQLVRHEDDVPLEGWDDALRGRLGFRASFSGDVTATVDVRPPATPSTVSSTTAAGCCAPLVFPADSFEGFDYRF